MLGLRGRLGFLLYIMEDVDVIHKLDRIFYSSLSTWHLIQCLLVITKARKRLLRFASRRLLIVISQLHAIMLSGKRWFAEHQAVTTKNKSRQWSSAYGDLPGSTEMGGLIRGEPPSLVAEMCHRSPTRGKPGWPRWLGAVLLVTDGLPQSLLIGSFVISEAVPHPLQPRNALWSQ